MNARELRIGNWTSINGYWVNVYEIANGVIEILNGVEPYSIHDINPIPLTEEWLVKFGFEPHGGIHFHSFKNGGYIAIGNDGSCGLYNNLSSYNRGTSFNQLKDVDFVHQLQNLYFALTGEELTLKPCQ